MKIAITLLEGLKRIREAEKRMWIKQDSLNAAKIIDLEIKSLNKAIKILNVHHSEAPKVGKHKESGNVCCKCGKELWSNIFIGDGNPP